MSDGGNEAEWMARSKANAELYAKAEDAFFSEIEKPMTARELALVLAEREACARIAETCAEEFWLGGEIWAARQVASAIRARNKEG